MPPIPPSAPASIAYVPGLGSSLMVNRLKIIGRNYIGYPTTGTAGTDYSVTSRIGCSIKGGISRFAMILGMVGPSYDEKGFNLPAFIQRAGVEITNAVIPVTVGGQRDVIAPATTAGYGMLSDVIGCPAAAGSTIYARVFSRQPKPPTSPAATAVAGGALTTSTTYYYKLTTVDNGLESGATSEVSAAASGSNLAVNLTWTAPSFGQYVNIYRSTATGTEKLLEQVPISRTSWTDGGYLSADASASPPSQNALNYLRPLGALDSCNNQGAGGNGSDQSLATGALTYAGGSGAQTFAVTPQLMLGDDLRNVSILALGDSKMAGSGISNACYGSTFRGFQNWFDASISNGQFGGTANFAIPGSVLNSMLNGTHLAALRLQAMRFADYVFCTLGVNDQGAYTWQQIASAHLYLAKQANMTGARYVGATLEPQTTSTDGFVTTANQTKSSNDAQRVNLNSWWRNGSQVDGSGNPVLSGGVMSPSIYAYFDTATAVEVNASNVLTQNGGYWMVPSAAAYTGQIITAVTSSTVFTVGAASYTANDNTHLGLTSYRLVMTSGALNGQTAIVRKNTSTQITTFSSGDTSTGAVTYLSASPAVNDTFSLYQTISFDGTHEAPAGHALISAAFATFAANTFVPFGSMLGS